MKQTVDLHSFREAFRTMGRDEQFSHEGLEVLFHLFQIIEQDTGEEYELDVAALCCDFYEDDYSEIARNYGLDIEGQVDADAAEVVREYLENKGVLIGEVSGGFVYRAH